MRNLKTHFMFILILSLSTISGVSYAASKHVVTVSFPKIFIIDDSEGTCGGNVGELRLELKVNNQDQTFRSNIVDRTPYDINKTFNIIVEDHEKIKIDVNGTEIDSGDSVWSCTDGNDPLGRIVKSYSKGNNWGHGNHSYSTKYYTIYYDIKTQKIQ